MMSLIRKLIPKGPERPDSEEVSLPEPRPEKVAEREFKDRVIAEHLKANARGRELVEQRAKTDTIRYLASLERAMAILGDRQ